MTEKSDNIELLAVLFISHGSRGDHLLFKYPFSQTRQLSQSNN